MMRALVGLIALVMGLAMVTASAHKVSRRDPNDVQGKLDIKKISMDHLRSGGSSIAKRNLRSETMRGHRGAGGVNVSMFFIQVFWGDEAIGRLFRAEPNAASSQWMLEFDGGTAAHVVYTERRGSGDNVRTVCKLSELGDAEVLARSRATFNNQNKSIKCRFGNWSLPRPA